MKRGLQLLVLASALALVVSACGGANAAGDDVASVADLENVDQEDPIAAGSDLGTEAEPTFDTVVDQEQALLDFSQCMRDNGVDIDDPTVDADGNIQLGRPRGSGPDADETFDREAVRAAREACSEYLDGFTLARNADVDRTLIEDTLLDYAVCMRDNGYDMPDPDFSAFGPGRGGGPFGALDREAPSFVAADEVCRSIFTEAGLEEGPGRGGPGRGGGGE